MITNDDQIYANRGLKKKKKLVKLVEVAIFEMGWKWVFSKSVGRISKGHFFKKFYIK